MEDFTAPGHWWLPSHEETSAFGTLDYSSSRGFVLDIPAGALGSQTQMVERFNRLGSLTDAGQVGCVMGRLKDGRAVALFDCVMAGGSMSFSGFPSERYRALRGSVGPEHLREDATVVEVRLKTSLLRDWVGASSLFREITFDESKKRILSVMDSCRPIEARQITQVGSFGIWLIHEFGGGGNPLRELKLTHDCRLRLVPEVPIGMHSCIEVVAGIVTFLEFSLDCVVQVEDLEIKTEPGGEWCHLGYPQGSQPVAPDERSTPWILLPLHGCALETPALLRSWLSLGGDQRHAADLLAALVSERVSDSRFRLLLAAQALESVHRSCMPGAELHQDEFEARTQQVLEGCRDPKTRSWVERKLRFANSKPLSTQLEELCSFAGPAMDRIAPNRRRFIDDLRRSRNFLAHGDESTSQPVDGEGFYVLTEAAVQLIRALMLRLLGANPEQTSQVLLKNEGFLRTTCRTAAYYSE